MLIHFKDSLYENVIYPQNIKQRIQSLCNFPGVAYNKKY